MALRSSSPPICASKTLAPSLRLGYAVADPQVMSRLVACKREADSAISQGERTDLPEHHDNIMKLRQGTSVAHILRRLPGGGQGLYRRHHPIPRPRSGIGFGF